MVSIFLWFCLNVSLYHLSREPSTTPSVPFDSITAILWFQPSMNGGGLSALAAQQMILLNRD